MKRRILAIISVLAISFSVFAFSANAVDGVDDGFGEEIVETDPPVIDPEPTFEPEPTYAPEPEPTYEPETEAPYYPEPDETEPYVEPTHSYVDTDDKLYFNNSDDDEVYVGGGQSTYTVPQTTAPQAEMYSVSRDDIDDKTLSDSDWNDISANLKNASNTGDSGDDFSFIKKNTSKTDNGNWMLYSGLACIVLSLAGITYFIVSTVKSKKSYAYAGKSANTSRAKRAKFDTADIEIPKYASKNNGTRFKH